MLTELVKYLQGQSKVGPINPEEVRFVQTDGNTGFQSLEKYSETRFRERYDMRTSSIEAFVSYTNDRITRFDDGAVITSVDPDACIASAIFNAQFESGEQGQCDDTSTCKLKPLPMWAYLMGIGEAECKSMGQRDVIDVIRDWHDYIPDSTKLVGSFTKLTIEGMNKTDATEKDFGRERTTMEKIDLKADGGEVPGDILVKMAPYDGFEMREVNIGVSAIINRADDIVIRLRVRGYEALKLTIAEEFAEKLTSGLSVAPIIGTIRAA